MSAAEAKRELFGIIRKRAKPEMVLLQSCHRAPNEIERVRCFLEIVQTPRENSRAVRNNGKSVATPHLLYLVRKCPCDGMWHDVVIDGGRCAHFHRLESVFQMSSEKIIEEFIVS